MRPEVALATPDGYTIGLANSVTHVLNGAIYSLKYDVVKDFEPVALLVNEPAVIVAKPSLPANNLRELIAWLKANPNNALAGTGGVGTVSDVVAYFFEKQTGTSIQHVPYRGLGPAIHFNIPTFCAYGNNPPAAMIGPTSPSGFNTHVSPVV